jgi:hypothetical protein
LAISINKSDILQASGTLIFDVENILSYPLIHDADIFDLDVEDKRSTVELRSF